MCSSSHAGSPAAAGSPAGVVAFGLHHDESLGRAEPFASAFRVAKDAGLRSAPHAGELAGIEVAAGEGPVAGERLLRALPEQHLELPGPHLEDDGECGVEGSDRLRHSFRLTV